MNIKKQLQNDSCFVMVCGIISKISNGKMSRFSKNSNQNKRLLTSAFLLLFFAFGLVGTVRWQWENILHALALTSVTIASGSTTLADTVDLTSQTVALAPDTGAYHWTWDGTEDLTELNFPFHTGTTQTNYALNGFNGTVQGGATFTTVGCQVGVCFDFDGVDDRVDISNAISRIAGQDTAAISFWYKSTDTTEDHELIWSISDKDAAFENVAISIGDYTTGFADESIGFSVQSGSNLLRMAVRNGHTAYKDQAWHHFVIVVDGVDNTIYVDGVKQAVSFLNGGVTTSEFSDIANPDSAYLMRRVRSGDDFFGKGQLDEFQFYPQPMNQARVTQLYNDGNSGLGGPTVIDNSKTTVGEVWNLSITPIDSSGVVGSTIASTNTTTITPALSLNSPADDENLIATVDASPPSGQYAYRWTKNSANVDTFYIPGNSGTTQEDLSGNNQDGVLINGASYTTSGRVGGAISFDGSNDYLRIPTSATLESGLQNGYTLSFWLYRTKDTVTGGWQQLVDNPFTSHTDPFYQVFMSLTEDHRVRLNHYDFEIGGIHSLESIPKNTWKHIAMVVDPQTGFYLYVDGQFQQARLGAPGTPLTTYNKNLNFGALVNCCQISTYTFGGMLDEIRFENRVLTEAELQQRFTDGNAGNASPTVVDSANHTSGDVWELFYTNINTAGSLLGEVSAGTTTITPAAETTTIVATTPSGTQSGAIPVSYTCSNSNDDERDLLVEYSTNGGSNFAPAMLSLPSSGEVLGSVITNAECEGATQTVTWGSIGNVVAKGSTNSTVQIRITPLTGGTAGTTSNFTVSNPINLCDGAGEASDLRLTAGETSFDNSDISIFNCAFTIDGAHTFTNMYVGGGGAPLDYTFLNHSDTSTSTEYRMNITATGDISIDGGYVNVLGRGYEGASTGYTNGNTQTGGPTAQTGGSHGGLGGIGASFGNVADSYGSVTAPTSLGGGGASHGGFTTQDGGGAVQFTANNLVNNGRVNVNGNNGSLSGNANGGGAGGSVYFLVTNEFSGTGAITANGGDAWGASFDAGGGGGGRVAVNAGTNTYTGTYQARGGQNNVGIGGGRGSAGTIYTKTAAQTNGNLIVDNEGYVAIEAGTPISGPATFDNVTIRDWGRASFTGVTAVTDDVLLDDNGWLEFANTGTSLFTIGGDVDVTNTSVFTHGYTTTSQEYRLELDVTGTVTIDGTSSLSSFGRGYNHGVTGYTNGNTTVGGPTVQNGGSHGGTGGSSGGTIADSYGLLTMPVSLGGGGAWHSGSNHTGNGGGALKITAATLELAGTISSNGREGNASNHADGGGAGGSIWIDVDTLNGAGSIVANGANGVGATFPAGGGAGGRLAVYAGTNNFTGSYEAYGGTGNLGGAVGGAGTIFRKLDAQTNGDLFIDNNNQAPWGETTPLPATPTTLDNVTVSGAARPLISDLDTLTGTLSVQDANTQISFAYSSPTTVSIGGNISVTGGGAITTSATTTSQEYKLDLSITGTTTIDASSSIHTNGKGYRTGPTGYTDGNTTAGGSGGQNGGSHGGVGGDMLIGDPANAFGNLLNPVTLGGGGAYHSGANHTGHGGGAIKLSTTTLTVNGTLSADGGDGNASNNADGGGAGGSLWLDVDTLAGNGTISTDGGDAAGIQAGWGKGGGAGGRTAIYVGTNNFTGTNTSYGGSSNTGNHGAGGTIFIQLDAEANGDLIVDDNSLAPSFDALTPLFVTSPGGLPTTYTFRDLSVLNLSELLIDSPCSGTPALTVTRTTDLSGSGTIVNNQPGTCTVSTAAINITPASLAAGINSVAYSESVMSDGGYAPKTYQCLDGLGGSVVTCDNANAGLPNGLTMSSAGLVSGTPSATGDFNFVVRVTDSDPGGAQTDEETISISIGSPPNIPVLVSPTNSSTTNDPTPDLTATYSDSDAGDTGTIDFRVSSGSSTDCINNVSVIWSGASAATTTNNEDVTVTIGAILSDLTTYNWCARNNDGVATSNAGVFTAMGDFTVDLSFVPGGASPQKQQAVQEQGGEDAPTEETPVQETQEQTDEESAQQEQQQEETQEQPVEEPVTPEPELPQQEQQEAPGDELPPPPPPPPTEEESSNIEDILDGIIELELEDTAPPGSPAPEPSPTETGIETTSQSDGRSFTIEVEDQVLEDELIVTGLAQTDQDRIEFTGTTSEPGATVTLIFNEGVTIVVTSDDTGFWQTFVNAEQLGIQPGQQAFVQIEAIASKNGLQSDRVTVGNLELTLTNEQEVVADFETIVAESDLVTSIRLFTKEAEEFIREQQVVIQQTLTVTAPIAVAASAPLWGYIPYVPTLIYHFIGYFFGLLGRRKRKEESLFGEVYDAITKEALSLVVLRIYNASNNKLVSTQVTDKAGRYSVLLPYGTYRVEARKPQFVFPSKIESFAPEFTLSEEQIALPRIPMDPVNVKRVFHLANILKKFWMMFQRIGRMLVVPVLFIGALTSLVTLLAAPDVWANWLLVLLYLALLVAQLRLRPLVRKAWGVVYDLATSAALPLTTIQLIDPEYGKIVKSRLTDYEGRFAFMPEPGKYLVKAEKPGYEQTEVVESPDKKHKPISGEFSIKKEGDRIDGDIAMKQL